MALRGVHRWGIKVGLAGGSATVVAVLGMAAAYADDGGAGSVDQINGWTVTPTSGSDVLTLPPATLSDPSNSLGLGTAPIAGGFASEPATPLSSIGSNESFGTPAPTDGSPDSLNIVDSWLPGAEMATVQTAGGETAAFLLPTSTGDQVVDLFNLNISDAPPLFNPDATGPIDIGGVQLADPQDGALFNDLYDALFRGDTADWSNATTLFDDLFGIDSSDAADAVDAGSALPDLGF